jgi:ribosome production factor 1
MKNPSKIRNKIKRNEIYAKYKQQKKKIQKKLKDERIKEVAELGEDAPPKQVARTIENTRDIDETTIDANDDEIMGDEHGKPGCYASAIFTPINDHLLPR